MILIKGIETVRNTCIFLFSNIKYILLFVEYILIYAIEYCQSVNKTYNRAAFVRVLQNRLSETIRAPFILQLRDE